jgi:hypothetical protein
MGQRKCLNEKRLTIKQVQELIATEGQLHAEFTAFFREEYPYGRVKQDKVYELPGDRFLYVFDEQGFSIPGKGDIYPKEYFLKMLQWHQRVRDDYAHNRGSSVDHWRFYSRYQQALIDRIPELKAELAHELVLSPELLDDSYASLNVVSKACERYRIDEVVAKLYDNVVAYVGEVIRKRVHGTWQVNTTHAGGPYPFISIGFASVQYMPINAAWSALTGIKEVDFRKEAADEVRREAVRADLARRSQALGLL